MSALFMCDYCATTSCSPAPAPKRLDSASPSTVKFLVTADERTIRDATIQMFNGRVLTRATPFFNMNAYAHDDVIFPKPADLRLSAAVDRLLASYAALPASAKEYDVFAFDPTMTFWESEYYVGSKAVPFHCHFLAHISRTSTNTAVSIFEYQPEVIARQKFMFFGHHGPGLYNDILAVPPTTRERLQLAQLIRTQLQSR